MNIFNQINEANSDLKAKQLLNMVTNKRFQNEKLAKEIELETLKNPKYISTQTPDPRYLFPKSLIPTLRKVN